MGQKHIPRLAGQQQRVDLRAAVVDRHKPIERNLRRERVTMDDLMSAARRQNIAALDDVAWAVMETSGEITFIKKS